MNLKELEGLATRTGDDEQAYYLLKHIQASLWPEVMELVKASEDLVSYLEESKTWCRDRIDCRHALDKFNEKLEGMSL